MSDLSGSIVGSIQQCKVSSYCLLLLLLLLQLRVVASAGGAHRFEIQTFRTVNGSDEFTVASCLSDVAFGYRPVTWRLNGLPVDFATNTRFSSSSKADAHSTRFFLQIKSPLSSDNGTVVTCQPEGYKESDAALFIVYDSAPVVEVIGDADVTVEEETLFQPRVRIFFSGGNLYLMYYQNEMQLGLETNVNGVYGTKDVSLSPLKVLKGMSGPLSVLVSLDGLPFSYPIFNLTVISRTVATPTTAPPSSTAAPSYNYSTKSINSNSAEMTSSAVTSVSSAFVTTRRTPANSVTVATTITASMESSPASSVHKNGGELLPVILGVSISFGVVFLGLLIVALILIRRKRNKFCTRTERIQNRSQDAETMQVRVTGQHNGATRAEGSFSVEDLANDVMDDQQKENERTREEVRRENQKTREEIRKENEKTREKIRLAEASNSKGILKEPERISTAL